MSTPPEHVHIVAQAPAKPVLGAPCNGCGVCCLLEPCPLGVLLSGYRQGRCRALRWQMEAGVYRCGAMTAPRELLGERLPQVLRPATPLLTRALGAMAGRWVAAGAGCDCDAELVDDVPPAPHV
jgi:hypothetical protein